MFTTRLTCTASCLLAGLAFCGPANAQAQPAPPGFTAQPVDTGTLATQRGGSTRVHNDMALTGTTSDNTAVRVNTGDNAISAGALANMSGMPVVIQNSGANVLIQNAVILNLQMN
jgi:hypothetical protein